MVEVHLLLGSLCQVIGYAIIAPGPPFAALCVGFFIDGIGISLQVRHSISRICILRRNLTLARTRNQTDLLQV